MDPLSVIGTVIALAGATNTSLSKLKQLFDAGRDLDTLAEEVVRCQIVFQEVKRSALERRGYSGLCPETNEHIFALLEAAKAKLESLNALIKRLSYSSSSADKRKVARLGWVRERSTCLALRAELQGLRFALSGLCEAASLSDLSRIYSKLDQFTVMSQDQFGQFRDNFQLLNDLPERLFNLLSSQHVLSAAPTENQQESDPVQQQDTRHDLTRKFLIPRHMTNGSYSPLPDPSNNSLTVRIRASSYRRHSCEGFCSCDCHTLYHFNTPLTASTLLGALFVGYSGWPSWRRPCNEPRCRRQSIPYIAFTYYFPQWLLARMFRIAFRLTYMNGPQVSLAMPRIIAGNSDVFNFAIQGNLEGIKSLFSKGLASPFDVCESNGRTPLHYAAGYNHREIAQFLIDTGAKDYIEDKEQATPISMSWVRIFKGFDDERSVNAWRVMFNDDEYLESRTFPILHKIILNLTTADLREQLQLSTANINAQDSEGRTALAWAAARNDVAAVKTLLEFQADPNACSPRGQSALHLAAQNPSPQCAEVLRALLDAHADVNCIDYWRRSALLYAGCNQDDPPCLKHLIEAGADLNVRDIRERTPLGYACRMGKDRVARYLIERGADLDIPDHWGLTPVLETIEHHSHETLQCLLEHGADLTATTNDGMTLLHHVALHGDVETFRLLANQHLINIDAAARDRSGRTAQDIFAQRGEADAAFTGAFQSLLDAVIQAQESVTASVRNSESESGVPDDEGEDEFFDAVDHQTVGDG